MAKELVGSKLRMHCPDFLDQASVHNQLNLALCIVDSELAFRHRISIGLKFSVSAETKICAAGNSINCDCRKRATDGPVQAVVPITKVSSPGLYWYDSPRSAEA